MMLGQTPILRRAAIRQAIGTFMARDDGAALLEFTIFAPLLVIMSIYTMDFGLVFFNQMQVQNGAQAAVDWAAANHAYNSTDMNAAVTNATSNTAISVSSGYPHLRCGCPSSAGVTFASTDYSGSGTCTTCGSSVGGLYVTVQTQATYNMFIAYGLFSGTAATRTLTAQATARIQ
jgi:Flp pilus assembly protein TadG